jgi:hypothetical protein
MNMVYSRLTARFSEAVTPIVPIMAVFHDTPKDRDAIPGYVRAVKWARANEDRIGAVMLDHEKRDGHVAMLPPRSSYATGQHDSHDEPDGRVLAALALRPMYARDIMVLADLPMPEVVKSLKRLSRRGKVESTMTPSGPARQINVWHLPGQKIEASSDKSIAKVKVFGGQGNRKWVAMPKDRT